MYTDLLLGVLKKYVNAQFLSAQASERCWIIRIRRKRPSLRVIISSATIDAAHFLDFFRQGNDSDDVVVVSLEGRQHPVEVAYLKEPTSDYVQTAAETAWKINIQVCTSIGCSE